jgi:hypothetical protein
MKTPETFKNCLLSINLSHECARQTGQTDHAGALNGLPIPLACFFAKQGIQIQGAESNRFRQAGAFGFAADDGQQNAGCAPWLAFTVFPLTQRRRARAKTKPCSAGGDTSAFEVDLLSRDCTGKSDLGAGGDALQSSNKGNVFDIPLGL